MRLSNNRYEEIKEEVSFLFEECGIDSYPIDCFAVAQKLYYDVVPYSQLKRHERLKALAESEDGYSSMYLDPSTGMFRWRIFYNDRYGIERVRWTIMHEIGHIYLDHFSSCKSYEEMESEANFFARNALAPLPLVNTTECKHPLDIADKFMVSFEASSYIFEAFQKWLVFGPRNYLPYEERILEQFHMA